MDLLMNNSVSKEMTILFADVAGSVELYSALGDMKAHDLIAHSLLSMTTIVERNEGKVVEEIGDEIMCLFNDANRALNAACTIQKKIQENIRSGQELILNFRVGLHSGLTNIENGHPFGDTVNVAARVVALAKASEILLTDNVYQLLSSMNKSRSHYFSQVYFKGKHTPYIIYQTFKDQTHETVMYQRKVTKPVERRRSVTQLHLQYNDTETNLTEGVELLLGRGEQCRLRVISEAASRIHATIKCQDGKLILTDRSSNGTFVKTMLGKRSSDNTELFFHHNEWMTTCNGVISLGSPITDNNTDIIYFRCS